MFSREFTSANNPTEKSSTIRERFTNFYNKLGNNQIIRSLLPYVELPFVNKKNRSNERIHDNKKNRFYYDLANNTNFLINNIFDNLLSSRIFHSLFTNPTESLHNNERTKFSLINFEHCDVFSLDNSGLIPINGKFYRTGKRTIFRELSIHHPNSTQCLSAAIIRLEDFEQSADELETQSTVFKETKQITISRVKIKVPNEEDKDLNIVLSSSKRKNSIKLFDINNGCMTISINSKTGKVKLIIEQLPESNNEQSYLQYFIRLGKKRSKTDTVSANIQQYIYTLDHGRFAEEYWDIIKNTNSLNKSQRQELLNLMNQLYNLNLLIDLPSDIHITNLNEPDPEDHYTPA